MVVRILFILLMIIAGCAGNSQIIEQAGRGVDGADLPLIQKKYLVSGGFHSMVLGPGGVVWLWGRNRFGQLGNGSYINRSNPVPASDLTGVEAVAAGEHHSLALAKDGTVWAWGANDAGQLGIVTKGRPQGKPTMVSGLVNIVSIAAGGKHSMALDAAGAVYEWGQKRAGDRQEWNYPTPVRLDALSDVVAIADGRNHTVAVLSDGTVYAWGENWSGQLGNGTTEGTPFPARVLGLDSVKSVAAGGSHTMFLKNDGTLWLAGSNESGQLGIKGVTSSTRPLKLSSLSGVVKIAAGADHSIALLSDATVVVWGLNDSGQLGNGLKNHNEPVPVRVKSVDDVIDIAAGVSYSLALTAKEGIWSWGGNQYGEIGNGESLDQLYAPKDVLSPVKVIFAR